MRTSRQDYADSTYEKALEAGCDTLQLKMDGWWSRTEIVSGDLKIYTRTGRHLSQFDLSLPQPITATIIGELMYGTNWSQKTNLQGKVFVFDLWQTQNEDIEAFRYKDRYGLLKALMPYLPDRYIRVSNFDIHSYPEVWKRFVVTGEYEGVVFRRKSDAVGASLLRHKNTIHDEYTALDFLEGEGKHAGRLGSIVCGDINGRALFTDDGRPATVGGGLDDDDRIEIWGNKEKYRGRKFEVEGKARFSSGLLRHPNIVRWKEL